MEELDGSILDLFGLLTSVIAVVTTLIILSVIFVGGRKAWDSHLLLATNTYVAVLLCSCLMLSLNLMTRLGDLRVYLETDSIICQIRGYVILFLYQWLFLTFTSQAIGRMVNVLHGNRHLLLQSLSTTALCMISIILLAFVLVGPHLIIRSVVYASEEFLCVINFRMWQNYLYMLPTMYLGLIIIIIIRHSSVRLSKARHSNMLRDALILRRTIILFFLLIILGVPPLLLWIMCLLTGNLYSLAYRIQIVALSVSILILSITLALINPQIKLFFIITCNRETLPVVETFRHRHISKEEVFFYRTVEHE